MCIFTSVAASRSPLSGHRKLSLVTLEMAQASLSSMVRFPGFNVLSALTCGTNRVLPVMLPLAKRAFFSNPDCLLALTITFALLWLMSRHDIRDSRKERRIQGSVWAYPSPLADKGGYDLEASLRMEGQDHRSPSSPGQDTPHMFCFYSLPGALFQGVQIASWSFRPIGHVTTATPSLQLEKGKKYRCHQVTGNGQPCF